MKNFNRAGKFGRRDSGRSGYGKPSSDRFEKSDRFERRDSRGSGRFSDDGERPGFEKRFEKEMHRVTCDKCGEKCEVPFRPTKDKPVYCYQCFKRDGDKGGTYTRGESNQSEQFERKFEEINEKLDRILSALGAD